MKHLYTIILFSFLIISNKLNAENRISFSENKKTLLNSKATNFVAPTATITGTTSVCQNAASPVITFKGSGGTAPYTFTYKINSGASQTVTTTGTSDSVTVTAPTSVSGIFIYTLVSVRDATIPLKEIVQTGSATITVNSLPTVDYTFTNDATCSGTLVQFTPSASGTGTKTYSWDFGDGTPISTDQNATHVFNALGCSTSTFTVELTVTVNGCSVKKTHVVTVKQKPDISFKDLDNPFKPFNNCTNAASNPVFTINVGNTSATTCASSYSINWGDGSAVVANATFPATHTYTASGAYNMVITALGTNGCSNSVTSVIKNVTNPSGGLVSPGTTENLCAPTDSLEFTIAKWGPNSSSTVYDIDYGDGTLVHLTQADMESSIYFDAADPSNSKEYPVPHSYTTTNCPNPQFIVKLLISNACGVTKTEVANITVYSKPIADFTSPLKACLNTSVSFTNTTLAGYNISCTQEALYEWDFGDGTTSTDVNPTHTYAALGNYTVKLVAQGYCGKSDPITKTICVESALTSGFTLNKNTGCIPLAVTATNTTIEGSTCSPPTYQWSVSYAAANCGTTDPLIPVQTTKNATFNFTEPGTYTITLTTTNSCGSVVTSRTVEVKKPPTAIIAPISDSCGSAAISPTATIDGCGSATSGLTYAWSFPGGLPATSNTAIPGTINYNTTGNYTVSLVVTSECGVSTTATQTFAVNKTPKVTNTVLSQTLCSGTTSTEVNLTSDIVGTTFTWTATATPGITGFVPSGTTDAIPASIITTTNSSAGTVTYAVTPEIGPCLGIPVNYVINVNPAPTITTQPISSSVCMGGSPTPLTVVLAGTTGTPTYQWYSNAANSTTGSIPITSATTNTFNPPSTTVGTLYYYCVITLPTGGCSGLTTDIVAVTITSQPTITQPLTLQSLCTGVTISTPLSVTSSGGSGTASYQWYSNTSNSNAGGTLISGAINDSYTPPVYTVAANYYYYVIVSVSGSGCGAITSNVSQVTVFNAPTVTTQPIASQVLCQGDVASQLTVAATGGNGAFLYQWYSNNVNDTATGTEISGATSANYLPPTAIAGTQYYYCVVSQSDLGCVVTSTIASVQISVSPTITVQPVSSTVCIGEAPTTLSFTFINGVGTPIYQWYSNTINSNTGGTILTGEMSAAYVPSTAASGTVYYYCVVDFPSLSGGCSVMTTDPTAVIVNDYPVIAPEVTKICTSNTFTVTPANSGGNIVPLGTTYTWTNPTINPAGTITGASAESIPQTNISQTLINTTANPSVVTYTVTPKFGDCIGNSFTVEVTVNPGINPNVTVNDNICFGTNTASISTNVTGGIPFSSGAPYIISWVGPNGFTSSATTISNLEPGNYDLTITDNGNCPYIDSYTITEPADIVISTISKLDISCFGSNNGSVDIDVIGGTGAFFYTWTKDGAPFATSQDLSNLTPGNYTISITDANNCGPKTDSFTIIEPPLLVVSLISKTDILCFGAATGAINIDVTGGTPSSSGYNFSWTGPDGFTDSNQNLANIIAGTYDLIVTDSQSCSKNLSVPITQSPEIIISYTTTPILCYGADNASISASISGGIPPYQYVWSNLATSLDQTNLGAGDYILSVTDSANCEKSQTITIDQVPVFAIDPEKKDISCFGANDGSIKLNLVGGIAPVTLVWSDGSTAGLTRNNLAKGTYTATISDGSSCELVETFEILEPQLLVLSANVTHAFDCNDANTGAINVLVSGGTAPFTYLWSNGATTEDLINLSAGNYSLTATDASGCSATEQYSINRPPPIVIAVDTKTDFNCDTKVVKQSFIAQVSGGVPPYQLSWSSGDVSGTNNEIMNTDQNGTVILNVIDDLGCTSNYTFNVDIPSLGNPSFTTNSIGYSTYGIYSIDDPIQFTNTSTDDFTNVSWDFGDGSFSNEINPVHVFKKEGDYMITQRVTYPFGCIYDYAVKLEIEKGYILVKPTAFTPNNDGINDYFSPVSTGLNDVVFEVYDTWGGLIYSESGDTIRGWDGKINNKDAENGNYYFKVTAKAFYGAAIKDQGAFVLIK